MTTKAKKNAKQVDIGLSDDQRLHVVRTLNLALADQNVLYNKTRNYHWNVVGPQFHSIHVLLEEQYTQLAVAIDDTAERIRQIGGHAVGTMQEWVEMSRLTEHPGKYPSAREMLTDLRNDHAAVVRQLREDIDKVDDEYEDVTTADFLTGQAAAHEKMLWMLDALIQE